MAFYAQLKHDGTLLIDKLMLAGGGSVEVSKEMAAYLKAAYADAVDVFERVVDDTADVADAEVHAAGDAAPAVVADATKTVEAVADEADAAAKDLAAAAGKAARASK